MEFLKSLTELGLPGWLIVVAALLFILRTVGLLNPLIEIIRGWSIFTQKQVVDKQTAEQEENQALWVQVVQLQTRVSNQNEALLNFVTELATKRLEKFKDEFRKEMRDLITKSQQLISETKELRRELTVFIQKSSFHKDNIEFIGSLPDILQKVQEDQNELGEKISKVLEREKV